MSFRVELLLTFVLTAAATTATLWLWWLPAQLPPRRDHEPVAVWKDGPATDALTPTATPTATEADEAGAATNAGRRSPPRADAHNTQTAAVLAPEEAAELADASDEAPLPPRGPGKYALLDLASAGVGALVVRQGAMDRDGGLPPGRAKAKVIHTLRGSSAVVELLHLAFDAEAQPIAAHIRTCHPPILEGIVALRIGDRPIRLTETDPPEGAARPGPGADTGEALPAPEPTSATAAPPAKVTGEAGGAPANPSPTQVDPRGN